MSEDLKVVTTIAMQGVLQQLEPEFANATGRGITMMFGPPSKAAQLIRDGEPADVVMTTPHNIDELTKDGKLVPGSAKVVARLIMGVAVRAGAAKPDIGTVENFRRAILAATSLVHANPAGGSPSAAHFLKVAAQLGIAEQVKAKALVSSGLIARHVANGEAELAVQQLSELLLVEGVELIGPFPPELQNEVLLAAGIHSEAAAPQAAAALIDLLASPRAKPVIEKAGLLPGG
jgi:molybdate transport system substrate-binding protein